MTPVPIAEVSNTNCFVNSAAVAIVVLVGSMPVDCILAIGVILGIKAENLTFVCFLVEDKLLIFR